MYPVLTLLPSSPAVHLSSGSLGALRLSQMLSSETNQQLNLYFPFWY